MKMTSCFAHMHKLLLFVLLFSSIQSFATAPKAPFNLRCFDKTNPVGTDSVPYFGWYINDPDNNEIQTAYQVIVASSLSNLNAGKGDVWDSKKTSSRLQNYVAYSGKSLSPGSRYYWKVRTWDKSGNVSAYSAATYFDTGLFRSADWSGAKWIKRNTTDADDYTFFRKKLNLLNKPVKRATAYLSASHSYEFFINGKSIHKGSNHHYPQYAYYQAYNITSALMPGTPNSIACFTHWYSGGQGRAAGSRGLLMKVVIEYADGTKAVINTDSTWKQKQAESWATGQPRRNGEGVGFVERIDAGKIIQDWNKTAFDDSQWQSATEIGGPQVAPWIGNLQPDLTRVIEKDLKPKSVLSLGGGKYLVDLGKVHAGMPRINFEGGKAGDVVTIHGGYLLNEDGKSINPRSNQGTNLDYFFTLDGKKATFAPVVYFAYRYLVIENSPNVLTSENVSFTSRHYELDPSKAFFTSSDDMLNKVWELMIHSLIVNAQENFVDTPTREKGGFLGDGGYQGPPSMTTMGDRVYNLRAVLEFFDSQNQFWPDGRINAVYPNDDNKRDIPDFTQAFVMWIWDYYMQTGNMQFLKEYYPKIKKIADYVDSYKNKTTGLIDKLAGGSGPYQYGIIDWPTPMRYGYDMANDSRTVVDGLAYFDFDIISKMAAILGNSTDKDLYRSKADSMKDAINKHLINNAGVYIDGLKTNGSQSTHVSQHANMFPMAAGIVPQKNKKAVMDTIKAKKMNVGMVTVRMLPEALGREDEALHLLELYTNPAWDGWAQTVALGGTTTWEVWRANTTNLSMSHAWGSVGLLGIQQYILGLKVIKPQHELIQVKPLDFEGQLTHAKGIFPTDKGNITVDWKRDKTRFLMTLSLPDNVTAKVYLPKSGSTGTKIKVDGIMVSGMEEGDYVFVEMIGSGLHSFERAVQ